MTTALVVGGMIGAGIFMLPVSLAPYGANAVIAWVVSGIGALALAFALARVASADGQGIQSYIETAFGPTAAFLVTWAFWVSAWAANAALAIATASALGRISPALSDPGMIVIVAVGLIAFLTAINAMGARATGRIAILTTAIKILPLLAVIVILGVRGSSGQPLAPLAPLPISFDNIAAAAALTLFALTGFETATAPVGKIRDPARNIPLAILGGTAFVALLYLLSSTAVTLILPTNSVVTSLAPFADAVGSEWGETAALLAAAGMAVSAFGCLNGGIMIAGELGYSMALRGDLPKPLTRTDRNNTAILSQLVAAAIAIALVLMNSSRETANLFTFVILLSTSATLYLYLVGALAALKQRPGLGPTLVIVVGLLFVAFAFYGVGAEANLWGVALLAAGLAIRFVMRRLNSRVPTPALEAAPAAPQE
ncbi:MAG: APC family permease [Sphingomicrobium sp.]